MHINEQREQETQQRGSNRPDVPEHARQDMVDQQKNRNKQATSMLQAGQNAPSHGGQEDVLNEFDDDWERDSRKPGEL